jgi:hypothetical protein
VDEVQMLEFHKVESIQVDGHSFDSYRIECDDEVVEFVAEVVRDLYVEDRVLMTSLREAASGLDEVCDEAELLRVIDVVAEAAIPQVRRDSGQPLHLQTPRNEVAEILALLVLEELHAYVVPASRVRNKEVAGQPSRGLDVMGLSEADQVVITEVKASSSRSSPPSVVHANSDSLYNESLRRLNNALSIVAELNWAMKHAKSEFIHRVAKALILYSRSPGPVSVVAPVLVRADGTYQSTDFGKFQEATDDFTDSPIQFVIIQLSTSLEQFAELVYQRARERAA